MTAHETVAFDVHDCKVYELLTDTTSASPTYGAAVDVPGIATVSFNPNLVTAELKGDARVIAKKGRTDRVQGSAQHGKLSLDVLEVILGGTVTDGTGRADWALGSPGSLPYFKLEFKIEDLDVGIGDLHVVMYKAQLTGGTLLDQSTDNFGQPTFDYDAIQPEHAATPMVRVILFDAVTALSA